jgi:hypothetical protein
VVKLQIFPLRLNLMSSICWFWQLTQTGFEGKTTSPHFGHLLPINCGFSPGDEGVLHKPSLQGTCFFSLAVISLLFNPFILECHFYMIHQPLPLEHIATYPQA